MKKNTYSFHHMEATGSKKHGQVGAQKKKGREKAMRLRPETQAQDSEGSSPTVNVDPRINPQLIKLGGVLPSERFPTKTKDTPEKNKQGFNS